MPSNPLPEYLNPFFWDVEATKIDPVKDYYFVIERLLEYGQDDVIKWLRKFYRDEDLIHVIKNSRKISKKTASLWRNYFNLPEEEIFCLHKSSPATGQSFWNY